MTKTEAKRYNKILRALKAAKVTLVTLTAEVKAALKKDSDSNGTD